jgi:Rieske Fe-S protein
MSDTRVKVFGEGSGDGPLARRTVLRGAALGGVSVTALAACGSDDGESSSDGGDDGSNGGTEPTDDGGGGGGGGGEALGPTSDVPVGGGVVYTEQEVVVTQPTAGDFVGFSAICTHQGCTVGEVADGTINCPCHGSMYSIEDGSVVGGPAPEPLAPENVSVQGKNIVLG